MEKKRKRFNGGEAIIPAISLAFGAAYFLQTWDASMVAIKWPYIIAAIALLLWLGVVACYLFDKRPRVKKMSLGWADISKPVLIFVAPIVYIATMQYIGFAIGSLLFLTILFRILGGLSWLRNFLVALSITSFLYVSMVILMKMALPRLAIGSFLL
jgi:hypothetical protein